MRTTIKCLKLGLVIASAQVFLFAQCNKEPKPCPGSGGYAFLSTAEWSPRNETYIVNDTLYLNSTIPKMLTDRVNTSLTVDYSNSVGIAGNLTLYEMDSSALRVIDAAAKFDVSAITGSVANHPDKPQSIRVYSFRENATDYTLRLGVVPKRKGLYVFFVSDLGSQGISNKNCSNANFNNTISNGNKNINLFSYAMGRPPASQYELDRIYCFRVQ